jgi:hypothetical protein
MNSFLGSKHLHVHSFENFFIFTYENNKINLLSSSDSADRGRSIIRVTSNANSTYSVKIKPVVDQ